MTLPLLGFKRDKECTQLRSCLAQNQQVADSSKAAIPMIYEFTWDAFFPLYRYFLLHALRQDNIKVLNEDFLTHESLLENLMKNSKSFKYL